MRPRALTEVNVTSRRDFSRLLALSGYAALFAKSGESWSATPPAAAPAVPDDAYWAALKAQFLVPRDVAVLNAANLCPSPGSVVEAAVNAHDLEHDLSPANRTRLHAAREETRAALATFLRVGPEEIVITRNTSESNNWVSSGLDLKPGDEVIAFADNHPSNLRAWQEKGQRFGYSVRVLPQPNPHPGPDYYVESFVKAVTPKTRLVGFSHVTNTIGDLLPARALCKAARERDVLSLVDGAQSFGLMDLDLGQLQPDFYSGSAHKWLCGPKEAGVLYVRKDVQPRLQPSVISLYAGEVGISKRLEGMGQRDDAAMQGFTEATRFQTRLGRAAIEARATGLAQQLSAGLREIQGVTLWTHASPERSHAVLAFAVAGADPARLQAALYERDRIVTAARNGQDRPGIRLSPHLYNTADEVERLLRAVRRVASQGI
jgi:selenocysteine lyase/cysteine desulfurase